MEEVVNNDIQRRKGAAISLVPMSSNHCLTCVFLHLVFFPGKFPENLGLFILSHNKGSSVNDAMDPRQCTVEYASFESTVAKAAELGQGSFVSRMQH